MTDRPAESFQDRLVRMETRMVKYQQTTAQHLAHIDALLVKVEGALNRLEAVVRELTHGDD